MNSGEEELQTRDPFQRELLQAVHKRRQHTDEIDENNNNQSFDAALNAKMSKYSTKNRADSIKKPQYIFDSKEEDEDDDNVMSGGRGLNKSMRSTEVNVSQKSNPSLKNSMERDSFLNAFLDRDANLKHDPFPFKSHKEASDTNEKSPTPTPRPRPTPRKDIAGNKQPEASKRQILDSNYRQEPLEGASQDYEKYSRGKDEPKTDNSKQLLEVASQGYDKYSRRKDEPNNDNNKQPFERASQDYEKYSRTKQQPKIDNNNEQPLEQASRDYEKYSRRKDVAKTDSNKYKRSEESVSKTDKIKSESDKKSVLNLNENKQIEKKNTSNIRTLEKSPRQNEFDKNSNLNSFKSPDFNEKADMKNVSKGQDRTQNKSLDINSILRDEQREELYKSKVSKEKSTDKLGKHSKPPSQDYKDSLFDTKERGENKKGSSKQTNDNNKYSANLEKFNQSLGGSSISESMNKSQKIVDQNGERFNQEKEKFLKDHDKSSKIAMERGINEHSSSRSQQRESGSFRNDRESSYNEKQNKEKKNNEIFSIQQEKESSSERNKNNKEVLSPRNNRRSSVKEKDLHIQQSKSPQHHERDPSSESDKTNKSGSVSPRYNRKSSTKDKDLHAKSPQHHERDPSLERDKNNKSGSVSPRNNRKSSIKDKDVNFPSKSPRHNGREQSLERDKNNKDKPLSPRNTRRPTSSKQKHETRVENDCNPHSRQDNRMRKDREERILSQNIIGTDPKRQQQGGIDGYTREKRTQSRENRSEFDNDGNDKGDQREHVNKPQMVRKPRPDLNNQFQPDSRSEHDFPQKQGSKREDFERSNNQQNSDLRKSREQKSNESLNEITSPRQRSKLAKQESISSEKPGNKGKQNPKDEELDSLFDAGSKRMSMTGNRQSGKVKDDSPVKRSSRSRVEDQPKEKKQGVKKKTKENTELTLKKKGPMKANLPLELATKSPALKNTAKKEILPRNRPLSASHKTKSLSFTNISNIHPSPRSKSPSSYDMSTMDAGTLREQIYADWLQRKHSFTKEGSKVKTMKKKQEEEEKERLKKERMQDAQKSFDHWAGRKTEVLQSRKQEEKKKTKQEKEKEDEKLQKQLEAKKFFESWKQHKDEELKEKFSKKKKEEKQKQSKELSDKIERTEDAKKIFDKWKSQKEEKLKDIQKGKRLEKKKAQEEELDKQERKQQAQRTFEAWKEKTSVRPPSPKLQQRPWCPSSRQRGSGIPDTVQPVIVRNVPSGNRTRTMSASARLQNNSKRSK